jgi:hypothetical protein
MMLVPHYVSQRLRMAGGSRYHTARRPESYREIMGMEYASELAVN